MKTTNKKISRQYLKEIRRSLSCQFFMKCEILKVLKQRINECDYNTIEDLYREIGRPDKLPGNFTSIYDAEQLNRNRNIACISIVLAIFALLLFGIYIISNDDYYTQIDTSTVIISSQGE